MRREIIKQYISSLKEDGELDFIFPLLLERMGYHVLSTPTQSKGQSQYGRDVVATKSVRGVEKLYLFELKGFAAKDINDRTLTVTDGLMDSLKASKYTDYCDNSIPGLSSLPRQYVFVHNGEVEANTMPTLNGFIKKEFPEGNFERWGLEKLTTLFSKFLFDETLLTDEQSYRLFKKTLVLLDAEGNDFSALQELIDLQVAKVECERKSNPRPLLSFFATMQLIADMVYYFAQESDNLYPAKFCIDTIILKTWAWILRGRRERRKRVIVHFQSLVMLQVQIYKAYLNKILPFMNLDKGLYSFESSDTEYLFYPLRCYDFLGDLLYYFILTESLVDVHVRRLEERMMILKTFIRKNSACTVPLLDTHSIPIQMVFKYMYNHISKEDESKAEDDIKTLGNFTIDTIINMCKRHSKTKMWPEMTGKRTALAKSLYEKSDDYCTSSSLLIIVMFELVAYLDSAPAYNAFKTVVEESGVNLQVAYPITEEYDIEQLLFEKRLYDELSVETNIKLPESIEAFRSSYTKKYNSIKYRTDSVGFRYLRVLAHKYYETDFFPDYLGRAYCSEVDAVEN